MPKLFTKANAPRIARLLLINFVFIALLHFVFVAIHLYAPNSPLAGYTWFFDLDAERNLPTLYTGALLLTIGFIAWSLRLKATRLSRKAFWAGFGLFFTYWALDEVLVLHERLAEPIRNTLQIGYNSVFYHAWVIAALGLIALLGIFILIYDHFRVPSITRKQAGLLTVLLLFMIGIVLLEIAGTKAYSNPQLYRFVMVPLEELFEIGMASYLLVKLLEFKR